ncbi:MAG: hypothetical protein QM811_13930 [Pirellulales bacterium]
MAGGSKNFSDVSVTTVFPSGNVGGNTSSTAAVFDADFAFFDCPSRSSAARENAGVTIAAKISARESVDVRGMVFSRGENGPLMTLI